MSLTIKYKKEHLLYLIQNKLEIDVYIVSQVSFYIKNTSTLWSYILEYLQIPLKKTPLKGSFLGSKC